MTSQAYLGLLVGAVSLATLQSAVADAVPFQVETRYHHSVVDLYQSPTYLVTRSSFEQKSEPGKIEEVYSTMNFDEYFVRYGDFRRETVWWDSGSSLSREWQFNSLTYDGPAASYPLNLVPVCSTVFWTTGVEMSLVTVNSHAELLVGDANGGGWQPPTDPNIDSTILSTTGDPSDIQPLKAMVTATDQATGNQISVAGIKVNGNYQDASGYAVFPTSANQKFIAQVSVPGNNDFRFSVSGTTHPPQILIPDSENPWFWGDDISKETTTVWAGQFVTLGCVLGGANPPPVESYEWVVDGDAVKEVQLVNTNGFFKIPLTVKTNSTITFAWLGASANPTVTCKVKIKGLEFSQKTSFTVSKPYCKEKAHRNGVIAPLPSVSSADGVKLTRIQAPLNSSGEINGYLATVTTRRELGFLETDFLFFQKIASSFREQRNADGLVIPEEFRSFQDRLDLSAPYPSAADFGNFSNSVDPDRGRILRDSPEMPIAASAVRAQVLDTFETWVIFKTDAHPSTYVPIAKNYWFWHWIYERPSSGIGVLSFDSWNVSGFESTNEFPTWTKIHVEQ